MDSTQYFIVNHNMPDFGHRRVSLLIRLIAGLIIVGSAVAQTGVENDVGSSFRKSFGELPSSVFLSGIKDGNYAIRISGIADVSPEGRKLDAHEPAFFQRPIDVIFRQNGILEVNVDHDKRTLELVLSKNLNKDGISKAVDVVAGSRSDMPCWDELVARDVKKSEKFRKDLFLVQSANGQTFSDDGTVILTTNGSWSAPIEIGSGHATGMLSIIRTAVPIGQDYRYMIRILDGESRPIWTNDTIAKGIIRVATSNRKSTGGQEIILHCSSSEGKVVYRIAPHEKGAVEPSEIPVDDSRPTPRQPPESPPPAKPGSAPK